MNLGADCRQPSPSGEDRPTGRRPRVRVPSPCPTDRAWAARPTEPSSGKGPVLLGRHAHDQHEQARRRGPIPVAEQRSRHHRARHHHPGAAAQRLHEAQRRQRGQRRGERRSPRWRRGTGAMPNSSGGSAPEAVGRGAVDQLAERQADEEDRDGVLRLRRRAAELPRQASAGWAGTCRWPSARRRSARRGSAARAGGGRRRCSIVHAHSTAGDRLQRRGTQR